jgi:hypothetical protein
MIIPILISLMVADSSAVKLLDDISLRYSSAAGIQWEIQSIVYSEIFEDSDTSYIDFEFFPPDTFSISSEQEKIGGIGDTIWVMSKRHKQIQKKIADSSVMPYNFILSWDENYLLVDYARNGKYSQFKLESFGEVLPENLLLVTDGKNRIRKVQYYDSKGRPISKISSRLSPKIMSLLT